MAIRWSQDAPEQLASIWEHIAEDSLEAARITVERILEAIDRLAAFPQSGRRGRIEWYARVDRASLRKSCTGRNRMRSPSKPSCTAAAGSSPAHLCGDHFAR